MTPDALGFRLEEDQPGDDEFFVLYDPWDENGEKFYVANLATAEVVETVDPDDYDDEEEALRAARKYAQIKNDGDDVCCPDCALNEGE